MERFRVVSDLHLDYNQEYPVSLPQDGVFTVIAGDLSGSRKLFFVKSTNPELSPYVNGGLLEHEFDGSVKMRFTFDGNGWRDGDRKTVDLAEYGVRLGWLAKPKKGDELEVECLTTGDWLRRNVGSGVFIAGNHIVYNYEHMPLETLKKDYAEEFPLSGDISFLDQSTGTLCKEVDGILFVGSTLYTDYRLQSGTNLEGKKLVEHNMRIASPKMSGGGMNDFNFGLTLEGTYEKPSWEGSVPYFHLTPKNYRTYFERTFAAIKDAAEANPGKEIVVVTHHCPSPKCISASYVDDLMNASYVSDLDDFILSHPQIRCWVCGHVHHRDSFRIGNCLCVMNPLGYCRHGQYCGKANGGNWSPDTFVNTEKWTLERKPYSNKAWDAELRRHSERAAAMSGFFF